MDQTMMYKGVFTTQAKNSFTTMLLDQVTGGGGERQADRQTSTLIPQTWIHLKTQKIFHATSVYIIPSAVQAIGRQARYKKEHGISQTMANKMKKLPNKLKRGYNDAADLMVLGSYNGWTMDYCMKDVIKAVTMSKQKGVLVTDNWTYFVNWYVFRLPLIAYGIYAFTGPPGYSFMSNMQDVGMCLCLSLLFCF